MRLTKENRQRILNQNEGYSTQTSYDSRNHSYDRIYTISDGELHIREKGKASWADSGYDKEWVADDEEVHRFLYERKNVLDTEGLE